MKLYYAPRTRAYPILWALEELGLPYDLEVLDLKAGAQQSETFKAVNGMMKVPALVEGDEVVSETGAILLHLADRAGGSSLIPAIGEAGRPTCLRWLFFVGSNFEPAMAERFSGYTPSPYTNGWGDFDRVRSVVEQALASGPWLLGSRFTVADLYLVADLRIAVMSKLIDGAQEPFASYLARAEAREAFQRAQSIDDAHAAM